MWNRHRPWEGETADDNFVTVNGPKRVLRDRREKKEVEEEEEEGRDLKTGLKKEKEICKHTFLCIMSGCIIAVDEMKKPDFTRSKK